MSRFGEKQFVRFVSGVLSSICAKKGRNRVLIVDSTDVSLDLNWFRKNDNQGRYGGKRVQMGIFFVKRLLYGL